MSTPRRAHDSPLWDAGTSAALRGRSRTCPIDDSTTKSPPRKREIVRAFAGDSTITSGLAIGERGLAGRAGNVKQRPPLRVRRYVVLPPLSARLCCSGGTSRRRRLLLGRPLGGSLARAFGGRLDTSGERGLQ